MRKPARQTTARTDAPQPAQMAALRRMLDNGDDEKALRRIDELKLEFPRFKPLYALACEVQGALGHPAQTAARAWEWLQASPNSASAARALADAARQADLSALFVHALTRLDALEGTSTVPAIDTIDGHLGTLTLDEALALDLSRMHLAAGRPNLAADVLQRQTSVSAGNNRVLALFGSGEVRPARDLAEDLWQRDSGNLFAADLAIRLRCWTDGLAAVQHRRDALLKTPPRRPEDCLARVLALRFLGDEDAAMSAWSEALPAGFWDGASREQRELFSELGADVSAGMDLPHEWWPMSWIETLRRLKNAAPKGSEAELNRRLGRAFATCDAHPDYLRRACEQGADLVPRLALSVLKARSRPGGDQGPPDAAIAVVLTELLVSLSSTDDERMQLLRWMNENGLRDASSAARVRVQGQVREVRGHAVDLHSEPSPSRLRGQAAELQDRWLAAIKAREFRRALEIARQMVAVAPREATALTCLAHSKLALDVDDVEITPLLRQAFELAPDYLFARVGLAERLLREGRLDEGRALLEPLHQVRRWHFSEYRSFMLAQRALALAAGQPEAVARIDETLQDLQREFT